MLPYCAVLTASGLYSNQQDAWLLIALSIVTGARQHGHTERGRCNTN
jgi:hypothetical protein